MIHDDLGENIHALYRPRRSFFLQQRGDLLLFDGAVECFEPEARGTVVVLFLEGSVLPSNELRTAINAAIKGRA